MKFTFYHFNFNVLDLERSIRFYDEALGSSPSARRPRRTASYKLVFLGDGETGFQLELTWLRDHKEPYDLGRGRDPPRHARGRLRGRAPKARGRWAPCAFVNEKMGVYFIEDPDGYWIEVLPRRDEQEPRETGTFCLHMEYKVVIIIRL